jgi:hypothetical protein
MIDPGDLIDRALSQVTVSSTWRMPVGMPTLAVPVTTVADVYPVIVKRAFVPSAPCRIRTFPTSSTTNTMP